jgi:hypothetical protein
MLQTKKVLSLFAFVLIWTIAICYAQDKPYYAFYPSSKGSDYKEFRHNIFGFSVDIPASWIFGIVNKNNLPVVLIYPEQIKTGEFTDSYETIEIGMITKNGISLEEASEYTLDGMQLGHVEYKILKAPYATNIDGQASRAFTATWISKSGFTIYEYIWLIAYKDEIRTICLRTTFDPEDKMGLYTNIVNSYEAFDRMQ